MATQETPLPYKIFKLFTNKQWQLCYERYLAHIYQRCDSVATVRQYQYVLRSLFSDPHRTPDAYASHEIEVFLRHTDRRKGFEGRPPSPHTFNNRLGILQSFYSYAARYEVPFRNSRRMLLHKPNPTANIRQLPLSQVNRTLTANELDRILAVIPRDTVQGLRDRALVLFYFWTARRKTEVLRLRWCDLEYGMLSNGKMGWIYHFRGKGHRAIDDKEELPPRAKEALDEYLVASGRMDRMQPEDPLFVSMHDASQALTGSGINKALRKYGEQAGIRGNLFCHRFRHTALFQRYKATNKDLVRVSRFARHKDINHTRKYLSAAEEPEDTELALLEQRFGHL